MVDESEIDKAKWIRDKERKETRCGKCNKSKNQQRSTSSNNKDEQRIENSREHKCDVEKEEKVELFFYLQTSCIFRKNTWAFSSKWKEQTSPNVQMERKVEEGCKGEEEKVWKDVCVETLCKSFWIPKSSTFSSAIYSFTIRSTRHIPSNSKTCV